MDLEDRVKEMFVLSPLTAVRFLLKMVEETAPVVVAARQLAAELDRNEGTLISREALCHAVHEVEPEVWAALGYADPVVLASEVGDPER